MKSQFPKIQILLPTLNSIKFIKDQVESIMNQVAVSISVLCSDDMSTDGTFEYLVSLSKTDSRIKVLPRIKKFGMAGKNFYYLIENANYNDNEFISFADHDDIWMEKKLSRAISVMKSNNFVGYSSSFTAFWENGIEKYVNKVGRGTRVKYDYLFSSPGPGCTFVLNSREMCQFKEYFLHQHIGKDVYYHDWLVYAWFRTLFPNKWIIDDKSFILHRQHLENDTGANLGIKAFRKRVELVTNGWISAEIGKIVWFLADTPNFNNVIKLFQRNRLMLAFSAFQFRRFNREAFGLFFLILLNIIDFTKIRRICRTVHEDYSDRHVSK